MAIDKEEKQELLKGKSPWLRVGAMTLTLLGPVINNMIARMQREQERQRQQAAILDAADSESKLIEQLRDLTNRGPVSDFMVRERVNSREQLALLQAQARQVQQQIEDLRQAAQRDLKKRNQVVRSLKKTGQNLNQAVHEQSEELLDRGSQFAQQLADRSSSLTGTIVERGSQFTEDLSDRSNQLFQDLGDRGNQLSKDINKRGKKLSRDLSKRGKGLTHDLSERGDALLQSFQGQKKTNRVWPILGFVVGLAGASILTYLLVRKRVSEQAPSEDQQIELPTKGYMSPLSNGRGSGESLNPDQESGNVATIAMLEIETTNQEIPADAAFVGDSISKLYYPIGAEVSGTNPIYFSSEEQARAQGYTPAS